MKTHLSKLNLFVFTFLIGFTAILKSQSFLCFKPAVNYTVLGAGSQPHGVKSGDFNGDGKLDVVVANSASASISILFGSASGTLSAPTNYSVGNGPEAITSGYINNDSFLDLAVCNYSSNNVSVLMGSASGTFASAVNYSLSGGSGSSMGITSADFNGDGKTDLAVANYVSNNFSILLGSTTGTFSPSTNVSVGGGYNPSSIVSADFNNDTKIDLAITCQGASSVAIYMGQGNGTFTNSGAYFTGLSPRAVSVGDFNMDAKLDLAVANFNGNNLSVLFGTGAGTFSGTTNYSTMTGPLSITSNDFNGDGNLDLATSNYNSNSLSVLLGSITGTFAPAVSFSSSVPFGIVSGDFNSDGKIDLVNALSAAGNVSVRLNGILVGANGGTICSGNNFVINPTGAINYTLNSGLTSSLNFVISPSITTNYTITGVGSTGCFNSTIITVSVNLTPTLSVSAGSICSGNSITISASGAATYSWNTSATTNTIAVSPTTTTIYSLTGTTNSCSTAQTTTINVTTTPSISIANTATSICTGGSATLTIIGSASSYSWNSGPTATSIVVSPTAATNYTAAGFNGSCVNIATTSINVSTSISVNVTSSNPTICIGQSATLTANGASSYTWNTGSNALSIVVTPTSSTSYSINGASGSCNGSAITTVNVDECLGVNSYFNNIPFSFYPNPNNGKIIIDIDSDMYKIEIVDILGKSYLQTNLINGKNSVDINHLSAGAYLLKVSGCTKINTVKIIKN